MRIGFVIPGALTEISGGYEYDRRLIKGAAALGVTLEHISVPFAMPNAQPSAEAAARLAAYPGPLLIDGLSLAALPEGCFLGLAHRMAVLAHHPLTLESGLCADQAARLKAREQAALEAARVIIVTSAHTAREVERIFGRCGAVCALPGVDRAARAACVGAPPKIISVGALTPRKAHHLAVEALATLANEAWAFDIIGPTDADPHCAQELRALIQSAGLAHRVNLRGAISDAAFKRAFSAADLFLSTSLYEGYGMAAAEAVNHGLPIVCARAGALYETAPSAILAEPTAKGFAAALKPLLQNKNKRRQAADASWALAAKSPRWDDTARIVVDALKGAFT